MGIRKKILLYFSLTSIMLVGIAMFFIYTLFSEYREQEFQQRQKEKIKFTFHFLTEIQRTDKELLESIDKLNINDLYNEKLLIFNSDSALIYSSIDDTTIPYSKDILSKLSKENPWVEKKDGLYDVVGIYFKHENHVYYGISKAYDTFGYSKLDYLKYILISTFITIIVFVIFVSYFLSEKITKPLIIITKKINNYDFNATYTPIEIEKSKNEISILAEQFNLLMKKMNDAFMFQKHAVHHISHELKTPIAVLVSNFEKLEKETNMDVLKNALKHQKEDTKSLSEIINSLLEIAKAESGNEFTQEKIRIDELIFDVTDELKNLYPDFHILVEYVSVNDVSNLVLAVNAHLLKAAFMNLMLNCIQYSNDNKAKIIIANENEKLKLSFENNGPIISNDERKFMFQHFFRGENSKGTRGFGLGLFFIHKIMRLHKGEVHYQSSNKNLNIFTLTFP